MGFNRRKDYFVSLREEKFWKEIENVLESLGSLEGVRLVIYIVRGDGRGWDVRDRERYWWKLMCWMSIELRFS